MGTERGAGEVVAGAGAVAGAEADAAATVGTSSPMAVSTEFICRIPYQQQNLFFVFPFLVCNIGYLSLLSFN